MLGRPELCLRRKHFPRSNHRVAVDRHRVIHIAGVAAGEGDHHGNGSRSEERRVGKECRSRWWPHHDKKNTRKTMANSMITNASKPVFVDACAANSVAG